MKRQTIINVINGLGFEASFRTHALIPNAVRIVVEDLNIGTVGRRIYPRLEENNAKKVQHFVNSLAETTLITGEKII